MSFKPAHLLAQQVLSGFLLVHVHCDARLKIGALDTREVRAQSDHHHLPVDKKGSTLRGKAWMDTGSHSESNEANTACKGLETVQHSWARCSLL